MKMKYWVFLICLLFSQIEISKAQTQLEHPKGSYVDSLNRYYQQAALPLYIFVATNPNEKPTQLVPNEDASMKPIFLDGHGKHFLKHDDALHNMADKFAIYADGIAPVSLSSFINAPVFNSGTRIFYGKNLNVSLSTKDEMSGVKDLYHSLNQSAYTKYTGSMNFDTEGENSYKFYAVDNVGNVEAPKVNNFIVDLSAPETFHNVVGIASNNIISTTTKIYLTLSDNLAGIAKTFYRLDDEADKTYPGSGLIPFTYLPDGDHTLTYYSIDNVSNRETAKQFQFYLDKSSPIMSADVLGDRFIVGDKVYFSGRTKLKLTAVDNKSGIKETMFSIDSEPFKQYEDPFYLPSKAGLHTIRYYAVDNMGNQGVGNTDARFDEYTHNVGQVYVDLTGPTMDNQFVGAKFQKGDTLYISSATKINLSAFDPESGLQKITYTIDGVGEETSFKEPFGIIKGGTHRVNYFGYDNVNNRNVRDIVFVVDNEGPEIFTTFSTNPVERYSDYDVYPSYINIFLAATDKETGYDEIRYSVNGSKELPYLGVLRGFDKNKEYTIGISAFDKLRNRSFKQVKFRTAKF